MPLKLTLLFGYDIFNTVASVKYPKLLKQWYKVLAKFGPPRCSTRSGCLQSYRASTGIVSLIYIGKWIVKEIRKLNQVFDPNLTIMLTFWFTCLPISNLRHIHLILNMYRNILCFNYKLRVVTCLICFLRFNYRYSLL